MDITVSVKDIHRQMLKDVERLSRNAERWYQEKPELWGYPTGLSRLDAMTGGMAPGELIVLAGGPGSGKTSMAQQVLEHSARVIEAEHWPQFNLLISAEMTRASLYMRMACTATGIDAASLRRGDISAGDLAAYKAALEELVSLPMLVVDTPGMTSENIKDLVNMLTDDDVKLAVVAVDYIQQLFDDGQGVQRVNQIMRNLNYVKMQSDCSLLALSQYSRGKLKENRPPQLEDMLGSGDIERSADKVYAIHDPVNVVTHEQHRGPVPKELYILKNRSGPKGKLVFEFDGEMTVFREPGGSIHAVK